MYIRVNDSFYSALNISTHISVTKTVLYRKLEYTCTAQLREYNINHETEKKNYRCVMERLKAQIGIAVPQRASVIVNICTLCVHMYPTPIVWSTF